MEAFLLYDVKDEEVCCREIVQTPVSTKWVKALTHVADSFPGVKVDRNFFDLFAAMLPVEAKEHLFIQAVRHKSDWHDGR